MTASFNNITFTDDPIAASLQQSAKDAEAGRAPRAADEALKGIYDLKLLNSILKEQGNPRSRSSR